MCVRARISSVYIVCTHLCSGEQSCFFNVNMNSVGIGSALPACFCLINFKDSALLQISGLSVLYQACIGYAQTHTFLWRFPLTDHTNTHTLTHTSEVNESKEEYTRRERIVH